MNPIPLGSKRSRTTVYEAVGGDQVFFRLVDAFYDGVARDAILRPMYPDDLTASKRHLALFLIQFFGGPPTYNAERGHPMLRARHLPFPIDQAARDAWVRNMAAALQTIDLPPAALEEFLTYFENTATFLMNQ
jgi:hemoglobin